MGKPGNESKKDEPPDSRFFDSPNAVFGLAAIGSGDQDSFKKSVTIPESKAFCRHPQH